jgi:hypothetical protein
MATDETRHREEPEERAKRDPIGLQHDWLTATEDGTGQSTLEEAIDVATGGDPRSPLLPDIPEGDRDGQSITKRFG